MIGDGASGPGLSNVPPTAQRQAPFAAGQAAGFSAQLQTNAAAVANSTARLQEIQARIDALNRDTSMSYAQKVYARQQLEAEAAAVRDSFRRQVMSP